MLDNLPALLSVYGVAFLSVWASIATGLVAQLNPVAIVVAATLSYATGVAMVVLPGQRVREWLTKKLGDRATVKPDSLMGRAWKRFGLVGLALLAPVTTGSQIGALVGLAFDVPPRKLLLWMTVGGLIWTTVFTVAISLGILGVQGAT